MLSWNNSSLTAKRVPGGHLNPRLTFLSEDDICLLTDSFCPASFWFGHTLSSFCAVPGLGLPALSAIGVQGGGMHASNGEVVDSLTGVLDNNPTGLEGLWDLGAKGDSWLMDFLTGGTTRTMGEKSTLFRFFISGLGVLLVLSSVAWFVWSPTSGALVCLTGIPAVLLPFCSVSSVLCTLESFPLGSRALVDFATCFSSAAFASLYCCLPLVHCATLRGDGGSTHGVIRTECSPIIAAFSWGLRSISPIKLKLVLQGWESRPRPGANNICQFCRPSSCSGLSCSGKSQTYQGEGCLVFSLALKAVEKDHAAKWPDGLT